MEFPVRHGSDGLDGFGARRNGATLVLAWGLIVGRRRGGPG
jgi:hypothetical protein